MAKARLGTRPLPRVSRANAAGVVIVALFAVAVFVFSRGDERTDRPDVVMVGDSFAEQSADQFLDLAERDGLHAEVMAYGGSSICSWEGQLAELVEREPRILVLSFAGNDLHPCVNPDKEFGRPPADVADIYRDDLDEVVSEFREADSRIVLVGPPPVENPALEGYASAIRRMYLDYQRDHPEIVVVDTSPLLGADHEFHQSLPCEDGEPCGPDGTVVLRQDDGIHLTPEGGKRYAQQVIAALDEVTA